MQHAIFSWSCTYETSLLNQDVVYNHYVCEVQRMWNKVKKGNCLYFWYSLYHLLPMCQEYIEIRLKFPAPKYKVVQIWPGLFVCKQVTVCPGHIWTTLYLLYFLKIRLYFRWAAVFKDRTTLKLPTFTGAYVILYEPRQRSQYID
jgi:hypothetical protein